MQITNTQKEFVKILQVQSNTLLLSDVFENFRNMCFEIYELDAHHFLTSPDLAWSAALKKTKVKLDLLTDMLCYLSKC